LGRHVEWLAGADGERFCNPMQLRNRSPDRDDDETADSRGGSCDDKSVAEAEFVNRDAVSDHPEAGDGGDSANNKQQD
jgi:hypothetical protein